MRTVSKILSALALAGTVVPTVTAPADAAVRHHRHHHYYSRAYYYHHKYCRYSSGTTGLVAGGVAGAVAGPSIIGHGLLGAAVGAVGGAVAGRAIDRSATAHRRCYYR
jgi:hypothetical protein